MIEIIMAVIAAIAAMQVAGGMDYLVSLAEKLLRRHPKYITFLAPLVTWFMTILAGTGHTAFSTLTCDYRSGERTRDSPIAPTVYCCCRLANRNYCFTDFCRSGVLLRHP